MKKVYIVFCRPDDDETFIDNIYSSMKKAEDVLNQDTSLKRQQGNAWYGEGRYYYIEEYEVS